MLTALALGKITIRGVGVDFFRQKVPYPQKSPEPIAAKLPSLAVGITLGTLDRTTAL
jgi:hypothetical protein